VIVNSNICLNSDLLECQIEEKIAKYTSKQLFALQSDELTCNHDREITKLATYKKLIQNLKMGSCCITEDYSDLFSTIKNNLNVL